MGYGYGPGWGMGGWGGYGWGFGLMHAAVSVTVIVAVVFLVIWAVRSLAGGPHHGPHPRRSAGLDVLEERYARGEIGRDEYLQKRGDLLGEASSR
ncbi:MAG TPA: SHOCT domain-containing protein [Pseudolabrys sp.]|nr:SHOCT domain-containing protein [Pseudolabrys sp.]